MRKLVVLTLFAALTFSAGAQLVHSISQDFNAGCASATGFPSNWAYYYPGTFIHDAQGDWQCTPTNGRSSTPGIMCTGHYNSVNNLDTSYLISPLLNLSTYAPGHVYLNFDTKTTVLHLGGKLSVLAVRSDTTITVATTMIDMSPVFGNPDSVNWVTHQVDFTNLEDSGNFYIAFRYTSTTSTGSIWYLDNINTTTLSLNVDNVTPELVPIRVIGAATSDHIMFSYTSAANAAYRLTLYDMMGRTVYSDLVNAQQGDATYTLNNLNLRAGMYCLKMGNEASYGTAKVIVQ